MAKTPRASCKPLTAAPRWIMVGALCVVAFLFVGLGVISLVRLIQSGKNAEGFSAHTSHKQVELVFLHMNGCTWCDKFKPVWDEMTSKHGERLERDMGVKMVSYERSESGAEPLMAHVRGFPTVLLVQDDGETINAFDGDRTVVALLAFVETEIGASAAAAREGYEADEPTEFGKLSAGVGAARVAADGTRASATSKLQKNAGGTVKGK
jgi:hypothetical protein